MSRQIPAFVTKHACLERMWNFGMFVMERIDKASLKPELRGKSTI